MQRVSLILVGLGLILTGASALEAGSAARDLGVPLDGVPGALNALTDVPGLAVGQLTMISGEGPHAVRTGVTAILPRGAKNDQPVFAALQVLNGNGEFTGAHWIAESGKLEGPVVFTNTHSVGAAMEGVIRWSLLHSSSPASLPAVAETWDGLLNDINGFHVRPTDVITALDSAVAGQPIEEGNVGGGTGMRAFDFKAGIGTASRLISLPAESAAEHAPPSPVRHYTVAVLVQANFGRRAQWVVAGVPVGRALTDRLPEVNRHPPGEGSLLALVATDAPLLPNQLAALARRVPLGMARTGATSLQSSGDFALAFSTAPIQTGNNYQANYLEETALDPLLGAVVEATEEAILNALLNARTMTGVNGNKMYAVDHDRLIEQLRLAGRLHLINHSAAPKE